MTPYEKAELEEILALLAHSRHLHEGGWPQAHDAAQEAENRLGELLQEHAKREAANAAQTPT